jgi:hypothetical protein
MLESPDPAAAFALLECPDHAGSVALLGHITPHFDCRLGSWATWEDARALLLWRAYDCAINGVSDAVHHAKGAPGRKEAVTQCVPFKLAWLHERGMLPLPEHQAHGTALVRVRRERDGVNPVTGEVVRVVRRVIDPAPPGSLLRLLLEGRLGDPSVR